MYRIERLVTQKRLHHVRTKVQNVRLEYFIPYTHGEEDNNSSKTTVSRFSSRIEEIVWENDTKFLVSLPNLLSEPEQRVIFVHLSRT